MRLHHTEKWLSFKLLDNNRNSIVKWSLRAKEPALLEYISFQNKDQRLPRQTYEWESAERAILRTF